jgi:hypothetical protein
VGLQGGGGAFVWNPQVSWTRELDIEIQARCGVVKHLVVPNKHYMTPKLKEWSKANPQAKVYAPPSADLKDDELVFDFFLTDDPKRDYVLDMDQVVFRGSSTDEVVFFHRPSETVLFGDLMQQTQKHDRNDGNFSSWWSHLSQSIFQIVAPTAHDDSHSPPNDQTQSAEYYTPYSWQLSFWWNGEQELARKALTVVLDKWKPSQIVLGGTNTIVSKYAIDALQQAFAWVPEYKTYPTDHPMDKALLGPFQRGTFSTGAGDGNKGEPRASVPRGQTQPDDEW